MATLSLWENADPPSAGVAAFTDSPINLGIVFIASDAVTASAVRYYRIAGSPHAAEQNRPEAVAVYRVSDGHLMVSTSTIPAIASGWNEVAVASTALAADTYYMAVAFYGGRGSNPNFTAEGGYFSGGSVTNGVLHSPDTDEVGAPHNGQYGYGSSLAMPTNTFNGGGYFVDVVVDTGAASASGASALSGRGTVAGAGAKGGRAAGSATTPGGGISGAATKGARGPGSVTAAPAASGAGFGARAGAGGVSGRGGPTGIVATARTGSGGVTVPGGRVTAAGLITPPLAAVLRLRAARASAGDLEATHD